jgi:rhamnulokinase
MPQARHYIACDLGAESGRVILGTLEGGRLALEEIHRFPTGAARIRGSLRWDLLRIFEELKAGLRKVAAKNLPVAGVSVDSWGVDYVLFNARQPMLALPHHYRDARTDRTFPEAIKKAGRERIFAETGIQFMALNTLYQLIAEVEENPDLVGIADQFLNIADYLNYLFSGTARAERSLASTTQIFNPRTGQWSAGLMHEFNIPAKIFPQIVSSGTKLGPLLPELREETGLPAVEVIASCSHDTGSAVAAVPAEGDDWAYLSCGTWSLIGVELPSPLINDSTREANFTNEAGFGGTTRFLKNIVGLWILQESRREWSRRGQTLAYAELDRHAAEAEPLRSLINPNAARFAKPEDMPGKIAAYCLETGQPAPETPGQFARCILESLALLYRHSLDELERLTGRRIARLHIVGGGSQSALLNQFAANATGRVVHAGPVEATAIGNVLIQAVALGDLASIDALRKVVRDSFPIQTHEPQGRAEWQNAIEHFAKLSLDT